MFSSPFSVLATNQSTGEGEDLYSDAVIIVENEESVPLYDSIETLKEVMLLINGIEVKLLKRDKGYSLIELTVKDEELLSINEHVSLNEVYQGYVENQYLLVDEEEAFLDEEQEPEENKDSEIHNERIDHEQLTRDEESEVTETDEGTNSKTLTSIPLRVQQEDSEVSASEAKVATANSLAASQTNILRGVAKKSPTNVRQTTSTKSKIIAQLPIGEVVNLQSYSEDWYSINIDGQTGYIHRKHVTIVKTNPEPRTGVAKKATTNVRAGASTKSKVLAKLPIGEVVNLQTFSKNWYSININGKTGYIHKKHVTIVNTKPKPEVVVANKSPTNVREGASTKSNVLTKVKRGKILNVQTFSKNWYSININGQTGYIHKKHVVEPEHFTFEGFAAKPKTNIRVSPSTKSEILTSVTKGTVIQYKLYNDHWYKTDVVINGKQTVGYIHKKHLIEKPTVYIDPGHGGSDPGSIGNGLQEKNVNLEIAKRVKKLLLNEGFDVIMSRETDVYIPLPERTKKANESFAHIYVSIHINSHHDSSANGVETWWYSKGPYPTESKKLANELQKELAKNTKMNNRGVKDGNLHVNRESQMPSALVEVGFISNKSDANKLKQSSFLDKVAKAIVNGIKNYFGLN